MSEHTNLRNTVTIDRDHYDALIREHHKLTAMTDFLNEIAAQDRRNFPPHGGSIAALAARACRDYDPTTQPFEKGTRSMKGPPAMTASPVERSGIADVIAERERQKSVEGWTTEHDDSHDEGEMAAAAACYASPTRAFKVDKIVGPTYEEFWSYVDLWPWSHAWWKPKDRRRDLVRAAALIVAEIERLDRLAIKQESK